ncbi:hypothetical protein WJX81_005514 [Elliptochloris bilobata]|uniref:Uncharacterized protein n=1 Tax=Elliptochloris bilobata TaxID=381761 RepID=A0AAW1SD16_9CHLO
MTVSMALVEAAFQDDGRAELDRTETNENLRRATALLRLAAEVVLHSQYSLEQVEAYVAPRAQPLLLAAVGAAFSGTQPSADEAAAVARLGKALAGAGLPAAVATAAHAELGEGLLARGRAVEAGRHVEAAMRASADLRDPAASRPQLAASFKAGGEDPAYLALLP